MTTDPVYTDFEIRKLLNQHKLRNQDIEGGDTMAYRIAKFVRDAVEDKILGIERYYENAEELDHDANDPRLLVNVFKDDVTVTEGKVFSTFVQMPISSERPPIPASMKSKDDLDDARPFEV